MNEKSDGRSTTQEHPANPATRRHLRPDWKEIDAWRARERDAGGDPGRLRKVAAAWAAAAGGAVSDTMVMLPRLPECMALAELKALAREAGLEVRELLQ